MGLSAIDLDAWERREHFNAQNDERPRARLAVSIATSGKYQQEDSCHLWKETVWESQE